MPDGDQDDASPDSPTAPNEPEDAELERLLLRCRPEIDPITLANVRRRLFGKTPSRPTKPTEEDQ